MKKSYWILILPFIFSGCIVKQVVQEESPRERGGNNYFSSQPQNDPYESYFSKPQRAVTMKLEEEKTPPPPPQATPVVEQPKPTQVATTPQTQTPVVTQPVTASQAPTTTIGFVDDTLEDVNKIEPNVTSVEMVGGYADVSYPVSMRTKQTTNKVGNKTGIVKVEIDGKIPSQQARMATQDLATQGTK